MTQAAASDTQPISISIDAESSVSGLWLCPPEASLCYVFAHGAGAGMHHASMRSVAEDLAQLRVATLRYQFTYMERGSRRPDPPARCHAAVRAAVARARELAPGLPLFAGGRSFGGRMTSQAQALAPLLQVRGLIFLGFPLHPPERPGIERAEHLAAVRLPMLFVQGTRDELATLDLLQPVIQRLGSRATLKLLEDADHSFHVPAKSGRKDADVRAEALSTMVQWMHAQARVDSSTL